MLDAIPCYATKCPAPNWEILERGFQHTAACREHSKEPEWKVAALILLSNVFRHNKAKSKRLLSQAKRLAESISMTVESCEAIVWGRIDQATIPVRSKIR